MQPAASTDGLPGPHSVFPDSSSCLDAPCVWDAYYLKRHPEKRVGVALIALAVFGCALILFQNILVALLAVIAVLLSIAEFLLPLRYTLDAQGARVSCGQMTWLEMPWHDVRSVYRVPNGLKISPFRDPKSALMEPLRGITLHFAPERLAQILSTVEHLRAQAIEARTAP